LSFAHLHPLWKEQSPGDPQGKEDTAYTWGEPDRGGPLTSSAPHGVLTHLKSAMLLTDTSLFGWVKASPRPGTAKLQGAAELSQQGDSVLGAAKAELGNQQQRAELLLAPRNSLKHPSIQL